MIRRTFIDKSTTIFKNSTDNFGLYPISMLNYGNIVSRVLLHFDINTINSIINNYHGEKEIKHILKMTNCGNIDMRKLGKPIPSSDINGIKERAVSFTIIALPITEDWDEGIGFDESSDFWLIGRSSTSSEASNWFNAKSGLEWQKKGIYNNHDIEIEYNKFKKGEDSKIISEQHFDHGNENLEMDITKYITNVKSNNNFGIMLCFIPYLEELDVNLTQYVGFFNEKTNTFFEPCIETRIDDSIKDNRFDFTCSNIENRLYLYCNIDGEYTDLDEIPLCTIDGVPYEVKKQFSGIYYASVNGKNFTPGMIIEDEWSNLFLNGDVIDNITMEFVTNSEKKHLSIGFDSNKVSILEPSLSGVNDFEKINKGEIRKIDIKFRVPYSTQFKFINNAYYRIYVKDKDNEITIIDWDNIENTGANNYFLLYTDEFVPNTYYVDIKANFGLQQKVFKNKLSFVIPNDTTRRTR